MEFYFSEVDEDVLILSADGGLVSLNADQFVDELDKYIQSGARKLIVDCRKLTFVSSYGLGVLVRLHKKLAKRGGDVKLAGVAGAIPKLLRMTRLDSMFQMYPDVDAALEAFRTPGPGTPAE